MVGGLVGEKCGVARQNGTASRRHTETRPSGSYAQPSRRISPKEHGVSGEQECPRAFACPPKHGRPGKPSHVPRSFFPLSRTGFSSQSAAASRILCAQFTLPLLARLAAASQCSVGTSSTSLNMTTPAQSPTRKKKPRRVNVRRPDVMTLVQGEVERHYRSSVVERIRESGGIYTVGTTTIRLAKQFGFCYGVERAIDLAYASRRVFPDSRIFLIGEIIHNQEVNHQLDRMNIRSLAWQELTDDYDQLTPDDVVIVPAFGAPTEFMDKIEERGCQVVDTTCGDVMSVWRRVRTYAKEGFTSIIHGKAGHEETRATASRALGDDGNGHYIVILNPAECDLVCDFIRHSGDPKAFMERFQNACSPGFDPNAHLKRIGVANQTTMLKSETEELQRRLQQAIVDRDGPEAAADHFRVFDTICGATQERQDALFDMLNHPMDLLLVVGGYNSSNTSHLVEIGQEHLPSFFIRNADCLRSLEEIVHFDLDRKEEVPAYTKKLAGEGPIVVGITAGASCPNNLIEATILKVLELRGEEIPADLLKAAEHNGIA